MKGTKIVLSYRREDSAGYTRLLYDRIAARFPDQVFLDIGIHPGQDFMEAIESAISASAVVLAVIGRTWIGAGPDGLSRLHHPDDVVRMELTAALSRDVQLIPIVLPGASLPLAEQLPEVLRPLVRRQAFFFTETSFEAEAAQLVRILTRELTPLIGPPVSVIPFMRQRYGWEMVFIIPEQHPQKIEYRFGDDPVFHSTHVLYNSQDPVTGSLVPKLTATVGHFAGARRMEVRYIDADGIECGPYHLTIDFDKWVVDHAKEALQYAPWIEFREHMGKLLVYFTHLLTHKNAFREIRYSVDNESTFERLIFHCDPSLPLDGIEDGDQAYLYVPNTTQFVAVRLSFVDGTESPVKRFSPQLRHTPRA